MIMYGHDGRPYDEGDGFYEQLNALGQRCRDVAVSKGFDDAWNKEKVDRYLLLIVSEACEAQNDLRDGHSPNEVWTEKDKDGLDKPCGFPIECADILIRVAHLMAAHEIDVTEMVRMKLAYNAQRPTKHGRQF